ncbi:MAG: efflux system, outer rane lipoprotein, NodT [Acidobacteria bacterium]|nr:efflux system, outer rane lipoprotein, NodT [Acidobacteriota bacterium]
MMKACAITACVCLLLAGCMVGPNYRRPAVQAPDVFRSPVPVPTPEQASLSDLKWWEVFRDEELQGLIRAALIGNYDLQDAVARVEAAGAVLGITRSDLLPNLSVTGTVSSNRISRNGASTLPQEFVPSQNRTFGTATLDLLSFEIDIWGRLRRATEAARAGLLGAEENRKAVITTLVSDVAAAYFTLRELDYELEVSKQTLVLRQESLELVRVRLGGGIATPIDLREAEQLVYSAAETIPRLEQQIAQTENRISLLLGRNPGAITRGRPLTEQEPPPEVPTGLPSALLERRPDIRAAEQNLIAANAEIGFARAAYFPRISLTGFLGGQSTQLASLLSASSSVWNFTPQATQPIFTAGRIRSTVRLAEARRRSALAEYQRTIQNAFAEVSNALIARQKVRESRMQQELLLTALQDRTRLAYVRYRGGIETLLHALDADRDQFQAELTLARTKLDELLSIVQLYKALGGGWQ